MLIKIDLESFANKVICFIPWEERSKEQLALYCRKWNRVIHKYCVHSFFNLRNILSWKLNEGAAEKYIIGVEAGMETDSLISNVYPSLKDDFLWQSARKRFNEFLVFFKLNFWLQKLDMLLSFFFFIRNHWIFKRRFSIANLSFRISRIFTLYLLFFSWLIIFIRNCKLRSFWLLETGLLFYLFPFNIFFLCWIIFGCWFFKLFELLNFR